MEHQFNCGESGTLPSGFCIFHDEDFLHDKSTSAKHEKIVGEKLGSMLKHAVSNDDQLVCIGFFLKDIVVPMVVAGKTWTVRTVKVRK
jgi:hypothetical protein